MATAEILAPAPAIEAPRDVVVFVGMSGQLLFDCHYQLLRRIGPDTLHVRDAFDGREFVGPASLFRPYDPARCICDSCYEAKAARAGQLRHRAAR